VGDSSGPPDESGRRGESRDDSGLGILREQLDVITNRDAHAFKGVFAQGLARLHAVDPDANPALMAFLVANADAFRDRVDFGVLWQDGTGPVNAASRMSAALLLNSVDLIERGRAARPSGGVGASRPGRASGEPGPDGDATRLTGWFGETADPPPVDGIRYEAEEAELRGLGTEAIHRGFTGAGYVAGWHRDGQGVQFTVAGGGTVTLRYAAGAGDAYRSIKVDGVLRAERLLFTGTGSWGRYSTVSLDLRLDAWARVEVCLHRAGGDRNYLNLDSLTVR
jgi:hypothetical protein